MENLCTSCLCSGRKLYFLRETGFEHLYLQIINEIPIYDIPDLCIRICWECKALLQRIEKFKEQVKSCYVELLQNIGQDSFQPNTSRLQVHQNDLLSYPQVVESYPEVTVKIETISLLDSGIPFMDDNVTMNDDDDDKTLVQAEDQCFEHETFMKNSNLDIIKKKKSGKKEDKHTKRKSKRNKLKIKKERGVKKKNKIQNKTATTEMNEVTTQIVESLIESAVTDSHNKEDGREQDAWMSDSIKFDKVTDKIEEKKNKISRNCKVKKVLPKLLSEPVSERPTCIECGKTFSSKKTYRYHLNVLHRGQNRYPCPRCGKVYQWKSNLGRHIRSHKARDSGELYCKTCDKRFASVATYRQHLRISKRHVSESEFTFMCNECGKKFVNKTRLRDHIDWEHLNKIKFKCQLCNKPFKCHTSLYVHMQNVHRSKDKKDNLCHVCGKSYQNAAKLKYHIVAMHTSETPYHCKQCNAAFGWYSSLYRHIREVHYKLKVQPKKKK